MARLILSTPYAHVYATGSIPTTAGEIAVYKGFFTFFVNFS